MFEFETQLLLMRIAKLVIEIAGLALVGQAFIYVLARGIGQDPSRNFFYRVLQITVSPFTWLVRKVTPRVVDDRHIPIAVFGLLAFAYAFVLFGIADACISHGYMVAECRRIR